MIQSLRFVLRRVFLATACALSLAFSAAGAPTPAVVPPASVGTLRLIGTARLPEGLEVDGTPVGGLSGIDYDAANDCWLAISDDRSERAPARFYTLRLDYDAVRVGAFEVTGAARLRRPDGSVYPNRKHLGAAGGEVVDPEALRLDPRDGSVWYTSEGDDVRRTPPQLLRADRAGTFLGELALPSAFAYDPTGASGTRLNATLEGLSFVPGSDGLWLGVEGPLIQDGLPPSLEHGAWARFTCVSREGTVRRQVAYLIDAVYFPPAPGKRADNGVSEVLALSDTRLLVLERNGAEQADGLWRFGVRLYEADISSASDIAGLPALVGTEFQPAKKRLLVDFQLLLPEGVWNLEGLAWGRRLSNGHLTLLVISDDNFDARQATECHVFEVIAAPARRAWDEPFEDVVHDEHRIAGFVGDYRWLSNFHPCRVEFAGLVYDSSEAAYQASKYPPEQRVEFTGLDADAAKKLSRKKGVDQAWWDGRKEQVMREVVQAKFAQNPELADLLLATGARVLEETNWWGDRYWGVVAGEGQNVLGKILMETRERLRGARTERR